MSTPIEALRIPQLEAIEEEAECVRAELEGLLELARDQYRAIQDAEVEADAGGDVGKVWARRWVARDELHAIRRQLVRAHATLIPARDPRAAAARQVAA